MPLLCSLALSLGIAWAVRYKTDVEAQLEKLLAREKEDAKLLGKCVEELKKSLELHGHEDAIDASRRATASSTRCSPSIEFCGGSQALDPAGKPVQCSWNVPLTPGISR